MQDAVEAQLVRQVNIITEKIGGIAVIGARVDEIARDMVEVKTHLGKLNGSVAKHERALTEVIAWQKAHNADHTTTREDRIASANRRVEWVKVIPQLLTAAAALVALFLSLQPHPSAQAAPMVVYVTVTPTATDTPDIRGGGGVPEHFDTPTPIVPRIIEVTPQGGQPTPNALGNIEHELSDARFVPVGPMNARICADKRCPIARRIAGLTPVRVYRMLILQSSGDTWLALDADTDRLWVAYIIGKSFFGTLECGGGTCYP